ncbi:hypothetical protein LJB85_02385 [Porphyromonadaceae bacterium OttesenSCG-928-L07]|nr:hypothetical protein [Porphyromonadaceae bacterium OttesenSCG-928-L07]
MQKEEFEKILKEENLSLAENWLIQKLEEDTMNNNTYMVSNFLSELILSTPATMGYPFEKLTEIDFLNIEKSKDGKLRIYEWHDSNPCYNIGNYNIIQYKSNGDVFSIDFTEAYFPDCIGEECWDEFRSFEVYTMSLSNKTYYLIEAGHFQAAAYLGYRDISIYAIENDKLVKQSVFKTFKDILSEIGFEYDATNYYYDFIDNNDNFDDYLFSYYDHSKIIYVPLGGTKESDLIVTDKYLLYQWNGKCFRYIGTEKGKRK